MKPDWNEIRRAYETNKSQTLGKLAARFGVPSGTVYSRASREHWKRRTEGEPPSLPEEQLQIKCRADALQKVADLLLDKIRDAAAACDAAAEAGARPTLKHLTGALKDLRDVQGLKEIGEETTVRVVVEGAGDWQD